MNTKHTPGPWHIGMHPGPIIYGADSSQVADCRGDLLDKGESLANLRLIAAAPDLLASLQAAAEELLRLVSLYGKTYEGKIGEPDVNVLINARAVIARATKGQS